MEAIMEQIAWYHNLSILCIGGMVLCMIITAILYKKLNIREVIRFYKRRGRRMLVLGLFCVGIIQSSAVQTEAAEVELPDVETEEPKQEEDLPPALLDFSVFPGNEELDNAFITEDEMYYYVKNLENEPDVKIFLKISDEQELFLEEQVHLEYRLEGTEEWSQLIDEQAEWLNTEENQFEISYAFDGAENETNIYEFRVSYIDSGNHELISELPQKYIFDKVSPAYEAVYTSETGEELKSNEEGSLLEPYYNAAKVIHLEFQIAEENLDEEKTSIKISALDRNGDLLQEMKVKREEQTISAVLDVDAHYEIQIKLVDKAGNETVHHKNFALDYAVPEETEISYSLENGSFLECIKSKLNFGYFAKEKVTANIQMKDFVSGVNKIIYTYEDVENGEAVTQTVEAVQDEQDKNLSKISIKLPFGFKGNLKVYGMDKLGNISQEIKDIGVIAESEETHLNTLMALVKTKSNGTKAKNYYNEDVSVSFFAQDQYSGINSVSYIAGSELDETVSYMEEPEIVTTKVEKAYVIRAETNNSNQILLGLKFRDNAGHTTELSADQLPIIHIDTLNPKVSVVYDNYDSENEKYYREERTATVLVTERNFDPKDVRFDVTGPEPEIGSWSHTAGAGCTGGSDPYHTEHSDTCIWKCIVRFSKDGDYRFGFSCTDLAGNEGSYGRMDEFVIDQTEPVITVTYDNHDVRNELFYRAPRTAKITIREKNFHSEDVDIRITAENEGKNILIPGISTWVSNGETHQAVITYDYDAAFTFDISYKDLAGNQAEDYIGDYFIVDLTKPEIIISEVADRSANRGNVSPMLTVTDINFRHGSTWVEMSGWHNGIIEISQSLVRNQESEIIRIQDIAHEPEMDDLYRLRVGAEDLAGNIAENTILFSVNRYGSVYTLDPVTEKLAGENGSYYTVREKSLSVTETNVDSLIFKEIICSLNGKVRTLKEGSDYTVEESGDENSWKQYRYNIKESNFTEEGHYILTIYSEDRANNVSDNHSKGKSIAFAVDKTAPDILISGVEQGGRYRENSREITVDVQDNLELSETTVFLNGIPYVFDRSRVDEADGKISVTVEGNNAWQTVKVISKDMAGNEAISEEITFLVTPNILVQFYNHKPLFYGSISLMVIIGICLILIINRKIKKDI